LDFVDGRDILLLDRDDSLAEGCVRMLRDDALAQRLAAAARRVVEERHDPARIARQISEVVRGRMQAPDRPRADGAA
jgi:glycosyltransferase involved in cell wall biosynthesis